MKKLLCLAACVFGLSFSAQADSYNVTTSNGSGCSQNEASNKNFSFGSEFDTVSQQGKLVAKFTIELGKKSRKIDCNRLYNISVKREQLSLDKANIEIELLKAQLEALKSGKAPKEAVGINNGDDW